MPTIFRKIESDIQVPLGNVKCQIYEDNQSQCLDMSEGFLNPQSLLAPFQLSNLIHNSRKTHTYYADKVSRDGLYTPCSIIFWSDNQAQTLSIETLKPSLSCGMSF